MIPKDEYSSGNSDDVCWCKLYGSTQKEVDAKEDKYLRLYPPQGYNTKTTTKDITTSRDGTKYYRIYMTRWHSCD